MPYQYWYGLLNLNLVGIPEPRYPNYHPLVILWSVNLSHSFRRRCDRASIEIRD
eukprot:COSAG02_NODE_42404_length_385_cov_0.468531_1_plen_53_part_10